MARPGPLLFLFALVAPLSALPVRAAADGPAADGSTADRLVNIDTAATAPRGALAGSLDVRILPNPEGIIYSALSARYGVCHDLEVGVRGVTGATRSAIARNGTSIAHGGQDAELYAKVGTNAVRNVRLALLGGVSFPHTPAQNQATGAVSAIGEMRVMDRVTAYLNPRAVFLKSNSIVGIGVGASIRLSDRARVVGDWTGMASGQNTLSTSDAARTKGDVWGVALRLTTGSEGSRFDLDLGWTNATGSTTGTSLTPGLGDSSGFYFALRARP